MDLLTRDELRNLIEKESKYSVSIYIPTVQARIDAKQGQVKLKNALREAENHLKDYGLKERDIKELLSPAEKFVEDTNFWLKHTDGLAIFISDNSFEYYRLPIEFNETVVVSDKFHIKPLLPLFTGDGGFYILAVSQNNIRLLQGIRDSISEIDLENVTTSLKEALKYDEFEKQLQFNTEGNRNNGSDSVLYHGNGAGDQDEKNQLLRYFQEVDKGLRDFFGDENYPLVFAGVDYLFPIYQEANHYSNLVEKDISGNPEHKTDKELHKEAWKILEPIFKKEQREAQGQFKELEDTEKASKNIREVVPAAYFQKVDTLFVSVSDKVWGEFHPKFNQANIHDEERDNSDELLNFAAINTILNGGKVYAVNSGQVPGGEKIAAIYRY